MPEFVGKNHNNVKINLKKVTFLLSRRNFTSVCLWSKRRFVYQYLLNLRVFLLTKEGDSTLHDLNIFRNVCAIVRGVEIEPDSTGCR